ncbi:hypothetical protein ACFO5X_11740 [Seohaeicola nanhaiensis]|uniref:Translocase n=1 Tax=Seohaeicola nanhaiensis TaxID=1387282 RepID=A0ABV9KGI1_9RHOB
MSRKRTLLTTAATVCCALTIGWVMQTTVEPPKGAAALVISPVAQADLEPGATPVEPPEVLADASEPQSLPQAPDQPELPITEIRLTSVATPLPPISDLARAVMSTVAFEPDSVPTLPDEPLAPYLGCDLTATATPAPQANVVLTLTAPCKANARVTLHHSGMMFTETTSADGRLEVMVPAMNEDAVFMIQFDDGKGTVASTHVPDLKGIDRVALQWSGQTGLQVHAREFGAAYGTDGHVWSGAATSQNGGMFQRLGDPAALGAKVVEVYTFPSHDAPHAGTVDLTVEAEVTASNCGRDISAQSIELRDSQSLRTQDLVLSMPECGSVGDFLVLNNLVDDLKIAGR